MHVGGKEQSRGLPSFLLAEFVLVAFTTFTSIDVSESDAEGDGALALLNDMLYSLG